jgi:hypothetical protein
LSVSLANPPRFLLGLLFVAIVEFELNMKKQAEKKDDKRRKGNSS